MEEYVAMYCRNTGRESIPNMDYYASYNFFRLAGILQGDGRARRHGKQCVTATANVDSDTARQDGVAVRERAGAVA